VSILIPEIVLAATPARIEIEAVQGLPEKNGMLAAGTRDTIW